LGLLGQQINYSFNSYNQLIVMSKKYFIPLTETTEIDSFALMIPSIASCPDPDAAPKRHFVPGPGASYQPPAKIV